MAYLFLSFWKKHDASTDLKKEFYNLSLTKQFELLQKRIPLERRVNSFQTFIEIFFPTDLEKKYYFSCPNFSRERDSSKKGNSSYLRNVVVRPEMTQMMKRYLPNNQNIILIGDIYESDKLKLLEIKGMQFIDDSMSSSLDICVSARACNAFTNEWGKNRDGKEVPFGVVWSINGVNKSDSVFTPNFVDYLISECYTVKKPEVVKETYDNWKQYIEFREYYLEVQAKRNFSLDSCEYIESYAVNRKDFKKNASTYEEYILDGHNEFKMGGMIVLSKKINDAESFPLIRLNIDRNKKEFEDACVEMRGKKINEEERKIRTLASDNVFITNINPIGSNKNNGKKQFNQALNSGYVLGEKFKVVSFDIEPIEHLNRLDIKFKSNLDEAYSRIDSKYNKKVEDELEIAVRNFQSEKEEEINNQILEFKRKLDSSLDDDVKNNEDLNIQKQIKQKKNEIRTRNQKK